MDGTDIMRFGPVLDAATVPQHPRDALAPRPCRRREGAARTHPDFVPLTGTHRRRDPSISDGVATGQGLSTPRRTVKTGGAG